MIIENQIPFGAQNINNNNIDSTNNNQTNNLSKPGYLTTLTLQGTCKNLSNGFIWENIPMFAVITGKNGAGKSAILETILKGYEKLLRYRAQFTQPDVVLTFNNSITKNQGYPHFFSFSSNSSAAKKVIGSAEHYSEEEYKKMVDEEFSDLRAFDYANRYHKKYTLKFPAKKSLYEQTIAEFLNKREQEPEDKYTYESIDDFYNALKELYIEKLGIHLSMYASLENYTKYLLKSVTTLQELNHYLQQKKFKYIISEQTFDAQNQIRGLQFKEPDKIEHIALNYFSPGEELELLILLWCYENEHFNKSATGAIFLLDEPDAHLHPSLTKELIEVIKTRLIGKYGVQVIMTTHSPTTVSLVPKENLYIMATDLQTKKPQLKKAVTKRQAIQLLTDDFVHVNEPFRIIFVEAPNDVLFYRTVFTQLVTREIIFPEFQLIFHTHGYKKKDSADNENQYENSSRERVETLIAKFTENDDEDKTLKDFVFGIVDNDNEAEPDNSNVQCLRRYAIENYLYDPVHVFYALKQQGKNNPGFKEVLQQVQMDLDQELILLPETLNAVLILQSETQTKILQTIIYTMAKKFIFELQKIILENQTINSEHYKNIIKNLQEQKTNLLTSNKQIVTSEQTVRFADGIELNYPDIFLKMRGHDLESIYQKIFPESLNMTYMLKFCKKAMLLPEELSNIFNFLQRPNTYVKQQTLTNLNKKRKSQSTLNKEEEIERIKQDVAKKDEKIKRQVQQLKLKEQTIQKHKKEKEELERKINELTNQLKQLEFEKTLSTTSSNSKDLMRWLPDKKPDDKAPDSTPTTDFDSVTYSRRT